MSINFNTNKLTSLSEGANHFASSMISSWEYIASIPEGFMPGQEVGVRVLRYVANNPLCPTKYYDYSKLKESVHQVEETTKRLEDAQTHEVRNKIIAFVKCILIIGLVVGAVLGTQAIAANFQGYTALGLGFLTVGAPLLSYIACAIYSAKKIAKNQPNYRIDSYTALTVFLFNAFLPIYEAFTRKSALTKKLDTLTKVQKLEIGNFILLFKKYGNRVLGSLKETIEKEPDSLEILTKQKEELTEFVKDINALSHEQMLALLK